MVEETNTETVETEEQTEVQGEQTEQTESTEKTFTQEQVNAMIKERLAREQKRSEAEKAEVKKLAKMNADQKQQYELEKAQNEAKEAQAQLAKYEMQGQARKMFSDSGIDPTDEDLSLIVTADAEETQQNANQLIGLIARVREDERTKLLKGETPKAGGAKLPTQVSQDEFNRMNMTEKVKLHADDPELFKKLTGGHE